MKIMGIPSDKEILYNFLLNVKSQPNSAVINSLSQLFTDRELEATNSVKVSETVTLESCLSKLDDLYLQPRTLENIKRVITDIYTSNNLMINKGKDKKAFLSIVPKLFSKDILKMISMYDYGLTAPKIVWLTFAQGLPKYELFLLILLNRLCFDIVLISTNGLADIEKEISNKLYTTDYIGSLDSTYINIETLENHFQKVEKTEPKKEKKVKEKKDNPLTKVIKFFI